MKTKKQQKRVLSQKERGVVLNAQAFKTIAGRCTFKGAKEDFVRAVVPKLLLGKKPSDEFEQQILSELRGMGLVRIDHTEIVTHD